MTIFCGWHVKINISDIAAYAVLTIRDDTILYSKCDQATGRVLTDLWQHLELASETLQTGAGNGLWISMLEKLMFFSLAIQITVVLLI